MVNESCGGMASADEGIFGIPFDNRRKWRSGPNVMKMGEGPRIASNECLTGKRAMRFPRRAGLA